MDDLIKKIQNKYDLTVLQHKTIRDTPKSLVIYLETTNGKFIAKALPLEKERLHFILNAEAHLRKNGVHIPDIQRTKNNKRYITHKESLFVLHQRLSWPNIAYTSPLRMERIGTVLGKFHAKSLGFSSKYGKLYNGAEKWSVEYKTDLAALEKWELQHTGKNDRKYTTVAEYLPFFKQAGVTAKEHLLSSPYFSTWKREPLTKHFLCHGDFNNGNLLVSNQRIAIIDWEDVRYDFPSKDITRVLSLAMRKNDQWNEELFSHLLRGYLRENPLSIRQLHLLFVDLAFPHIIERFLRKKQYDQMNLAEIQQFCNREALKTAFMLDEMKAHVY
ncbi:phosphotransferase [Brevibacillus sp. HB2.2]|uniref:phosphotransferase n=1 Tax=Brevibacillus sp. HB2.2 TaxID=2738846 RepID=UPI00156A9CF7|nr:phosphotransferase [Brevibacillus sp. HB2.2]NRS47409.1 phosphotransferase [Brevibacillus sp. HB2.2]